MKTRPKIAQIALAVGNEDGVIARFVACLDEHGQAWVLTHGKWMKLPPLPAEEDQDGKA